MLITLALKDPSRTKITLTSPKELSIFANLEKWNLDIVFETKPPNQQAKREPNLQYPEQNSIFGLQA